MAVIPTSNVDSLGITTESIESGSAPARDDTMIRRTQRGSAVRTVSAESPGKIHLHQLDVLRGICALVLVIYHAEFDYPGRDLGLLRNGPLFVDFFFSLSGFIILHNYRSMNTLNDVARFMTLRFFRIYPLHLTMLCAFLSYEVLQYALVRVTGLSSRTSPFSDVSLVDVLVHVTLLNGLGLRPLSFNVPAWSISVEFWTYIVFGVTVWACRAHSRWLRAALVAIAGLAVLRFVAQPEPRLTLLNDHFLTRCIYGFFLGAGLRAFIHVPRQQTRVGSARLGSFVQAGSVAGTLVLLAAAGDPTRWLELLAPPMFALVIACFALWPKTPLVRALNTGPCLWLGKLSYSVYMVHLLVLLIIQAFLRLVLHVPVEGELIRPNALVGALTMAVYIATVLGVSSLTYRLIEDPGRRVGRELLRRRQGTP